MVKFISAKDTLALRSEQLRNNAPAKDCVLDTDEVNGAFHLGCFVADEVVSVASFFPKNYKNEVEPGYQLRGMATAAGFAGKGYGAQLVEFAKVQLNATSATYLWCNARTKAIGFYQKMGFELASAEFEIAGIGPHYEMILKLK